jgi:polyhydroxyalkanoate synthesis regulator phasin
MIKKFDEYEVVNEASLKGNPGIPGEGDKPGSYLPDVDAKAEAKNREFSRTHGRDIPQFMGFVREAHMIQAGHEKELEKIAEEAIRENYGAILDGVELNIKFPKRGEIEQSMSSAPGKPSPEAVFKALEDANIISEIHKRKIANNIAQGEAKNTKTILNMPSITRKVNIALGRESGERYVELLNKITEIASFFDWAIPMEVQQEMWERDKSGFAGSVSIEWETPEDPEETEELAQDILDKLIENPELPADDTEELFDQVSPTINALGTDFAMLLHETIKGIYELISACAIPDDEEEATTIISNTDTLADELEDLRYGPEIAADIRDFINEFKESDTVENLREFIFGKMMMLPAPEFLDLIFKILSDDAEAKVIVQDMIDEIKKELNDYELAGSGITNKEYTVDAEPDEEETDTDGNPDYSKMAKKDVQKLIDKYLENGEFDKIDAALPFLKESKQEEYGGKISEKLNERVQLGY